jgi:hypothetical protein
MPAFFATPTVQTTTGKRGSTTGRKATRTNRGAEGSWIAEQKEALGRKVWVRQVWFRVKVAARWVSPRTGEVTVAESYTPLFATRERAAGEKARQVAIHADPVRSNGWELVSVGDIEEYTIDVVMYETEAKGVIVGVADGRLAIGRTR